MDSNRKQTQQGETKQNKRAKTTSTTTTSDTSAAPHPSFFVQSELIPSEYKDKIGITKGANQRVQTAHWVVVYSFLDFSFVDRIKMRCMCRLFDKVENVLTLNEHGYEMLLPIPKWTEFPHPKYSTLNGLMDRLNGVYAALPSDWVKCTASGTLVVGRKCRAKYVRRGNVSIKDATVQKVNEDDDDDDDETFDIVFDFDDGEVRTRKNVPLNEIQIQNVSAVLLYI